MAILKTPAKYDPATERWEPGTETTVSYEGRVLAVYHKDYRAMSDVYTWATYAEVLGDDGLLHEVMVNANFECDVSGGRAVVDATPEVIAQAEALRAAAAAEAERRAEAARQAAAEREARAPRVGRTVKVVKGRKVPVGTTGFCFWTGPGRAYSGHYAGDRVGIETDAGQRYFTAASNCEAVS